MQRALTTIVLLGLLLATAGAFALTEHLKLIKSPIYATDVTKKFSPVCHCATAKAEIGFKLRHPDTLTVTIVSDGKVVDTVATDAKVQQKGVLVTFPWDGRTTTGVATAGTAYQPQVELKNERRTILMPNVIAVDTTPPKVLSATAGDGILIRRAGHSLPLQYTFNEKAHAAVYLGGRRVILGRTTRPSDKVNWNGKVDGRTLWPGRYVLEVGAIDVAGNETPPAERKRLVVLIRFIALDQSSIHVPAGGRFTVEVRTGAPHYTWKFSGKRGTGKKKLLHLRAPTHRGRYRLVVTGSGHSAYATVLVRRR